MAKIKTVVREVGSKRSLMTITYDADKLDYVMFEVERIRGKALNKFGDAIPLEFEHTVVQGKSPTGFKTWAKKTFNKWVSYESAITV